MMNKEPTVEERLAALEKRCKELEDELLRVRRWAKIPPRSYNHGPL